jgi:hypothetical protein
VGFKNQSYMRVFTVEFGRGWVDTATHRAVVALKMPFIESIPFV